MSTFWADQTFWATPIVYDALDVFGLDELVRVEFVDPFLDGPQTLACAQLVQRRPWEAPYGLIRCSKYYWQRLGVKERRATLLHEAAHIIDLFQTGTSSHGGNWQRIMVILGQNPERFYRGHVSAVRERENCSVSSRIGGRHMGRKDNSA